MFLRKIARGLIIQRPCFNFAKKQESLIKSVEGNRPPSYEESVHGKYAGVLFSSASERSALHLVLKDMQLLSQLIKENEEFRNFIGNAAYKRQQQFDVLDSFDNFHEYSINLLHTLVENRRLGSLAKICDKYIEYYKISNKEETIIIVSADELTSEQQSRVKDALVQGRKNDNFSLTFSVDPSIQGGLQMYSGLEFLDCSLSSRIYKLKSELQKINF